MIKQTRQNILKNLDSTLSSWNGEDSLESIVFKREYLIFLEPVYECDLEKSIGKLIKFDYYLFNEVLDQLKNFFDQIREEGFFTIESLDENVVHAYLIIREIDPFIDDLEFIQNADSNQNNIWRNGHLHESKISNIFNCQKINFQFFQIKQIGSQTFSKFNNLIELSLTNCAIDNLDQSFFSNILSLKILNLSFNQFFNLGSSLFFTLTNLEELILCGCDISSIDKECFKNLYSIKLLDLSKNSLQKVEPDWFKDMPNTEVLYLNSNKIETLNESTFSYLNNLRYLNISKNRIENIEAKVFNGLQNINEICYDLFYDLKTILGDSFKHVKYHPSQNNVM
ncbi:leucine-rich repeat neuronal 3-like [Brachionus plicatilis]|uniref:Leucine-rich repeat neuronal 3-like n=1 Tax=Brachionus plicatilis TaxID=10195 RepID=A0A3M7P6T3_BRAPC|nr:leucine-rich repeat neuronal 3-like [Brachionus plicatilis]